MRAAAVVVIALLAAPAIGGEALSPRATDESELSYARFAEEHDPSHPLFCMYGYFASKTGDHATAHRIFERCAAEAHSGAALVYLSMFYEEGIGAPRDPVKAEALMRQAAEDGYSVAQYNLGAALLKQSDDPATRAEALRWLAAAAAQGDADAAALLEKGGV